MTEAGGQRQHSHGPLIWLASRSPRRRELLHAHHYSFHLVSSSFRESIRRHETPDRAVQRNARGKALGAAVPEGAAGVVLGADTVVYCRERILGKPRTLKAAREMLAWIQGRRHWVFTGIFLRDLRSGWEHGAYEKTAVFIRKLSADEIAHIVTVTRPFDKAGAYAIQDERLRLIERTQGSFSNVVGLPMERLEEALQSWRESRC